MMNLMERDDRTELNCIRPCVARWVERTKLSCSVCLKKFEPVRARAAMSLQRRKEIVAGAAVECKASISTSFHPPKATENQMEPDTGERFHRETCEIDGGGGGGLKVAGIRVQPPFVMD